MCPTLVDGNIVPCVVNPIGENNALGWVGNINPSAKRTGTPELYDRPTAITGRRLCNHVAQTQHLEMFWSVTGNLTAFSIPNHVGHRWRLNMHPDSGASGPL